MVPEDAHYTEDHQWIRVGDHGAEVGITDYAQGELGDITYVELPAIGRTFDQGEEIAVIESVKAASDVYAPISGTVAAVNTTLEDSPETINRDPYCDGWLCRFRESDSDETAIKKLMTAEQYEQYIRR